MSERCQALDSLVLTTHIIIIIVVVVIGVDDVDGQRGGQNGEAHEVEGIEIVCWAGGAPEAAVTDIHHFVVTKTQDIFQSLELQQLPTLSYLEFVLTVSKQTTVFLFD